MEPEFKEPLGGMAFAGVAALALGFLAIAVARRAY
jgi:hypothetical protein